MFIVKIALNAWIVEDVKNVLNAQIAGAVKDAVIVMAVKI